MRIAGDDGRVNALPARKSLVLIDPFGWPDCRQDGFCAEAGFELIERSAALDPSAYFAPRADSFSEEELAEAQAALIEDGVFADGAWTREYLDRDFAISDALTLRFTPDSLARVAVKFGWALAYAAELGGAREITFAATDTSTQPHEHLFIALELRRRAVPFAALALSWPGEFEPAVEFTGDVEKFAGALATHAAIARFAGPYQLSFPHAEEKLALLPLIARECGDAFHLQLSGVAWMEALRLIARGAPELFRELLCAAQEHFIFDRVGHPLSTTEDDVRFLPSVPDAQLENTFLDDPRGRQLLHVTAGSILANPALAEPLRAIGTANAAAFRELCAAQLDRHLRALTGAERTT
jgi:hypothetical protein